MSKAELPQRFEDSLGYLLHHLMYAFRQGLTRRTARLDVRLTHEEIMVLLLLRQEGGQTQSRIAATLAKDKALITRLLNGLVRKGLVDRVPDASDRRLVRAFLGPSGAELAERLFPLLMDYIAEALEGVEQAEFDAACRMLRRMLDNLRACAGKGLGE